MDIPNIYLYIHTTIKTKMKKSNGYYVKIRNQ